MKFNKLLLMALICPILLTSSSASAVKKLKLDSVKIRNNFGKTIASQCTWQDRNGAHSKQITNITIKNGKTLKAKGPMLGYRIREITAMQSSLVAAAAGSATLSGGVGGTGALIKVFMGKTKAKKNKYFVVTTGKKPKGAQDHVAIIRGYRNKATYKIHKRHIAFKKANKNLELAKNNPKYNDVALQTLQDLFDKADAAYTQEDRAYFEALKAVKVFKKGPGKSKKAKKALNKDMKKARKAAIEKHKEVKVERKQLNKENKAERKQLKRDEKEQKKNDKLQEDLDYLDSYDYESFEASQY